MTEHVHSIQNISLEKGEFMTEIYPITSADLTEAKIQTIEKSKITLQK